MTAKELRDTVALAIQRAATNTTIFTWKELGIIEKRYYGDCADAALAVMIPELALSTALMERADARIAQLEQTVREWESGVRSRTATGGKYESG